MEHCDRNKDGRLSGREFKFVLVGRPRKAIQALRDFNLCVGGSILPGGGGFQYDAKNDILGGLSCNVFDDDDDDDDDGPSAPTKDIKRWSDKKIRKQYERNPKTVSHHVMMLIEKSETVFGWECDKINQRENVGFIQNSVRGKIPRTPLESRT